MRLLAMLTAAAAATFALPAAAAVVASSLPYQNTPDWSDVIFGATSMVNNGTSTTLTTAQGNGIYFGWQAGSNPPAWSPASNASGNYLDLTFDLSPGARDWSAYFHDGSRYAALLFNPTINCNGNVTNCTLAPFAAGVTLSFATPTNVAADVFVPLDLTVINRFEFLLRGSQVDYRINGRRYTGTAGQTGSTILVIGDGSGSTLTGSGSMTVRAVSFETAPAFSELPNLVTGVPEPDSWAMLVVGFGLAGAAFRRRRSALA